MIRQKILQQLLEWIECNLEHPISIEDTLATRLTR